MNKTMDECGSLLVGYGHIPRQHRVDNMSKQWALILLVVNSVSSLQVYESVEEGATTNGDTTTLYPVNNHRNRTVEEGSSGEHENSDDVKNKRKIKTAATVWKVDAAYAVPNEERNTTDFKEPVIEKPEDNGNFKPSTHLGNFFDTDSAESPTVKQQFGRHFHGTIRKPPSGFKFTKEIKKPAKHGWKIAPPLYMQAGDLYKIPEPFKETQGSEQDHNFEVDFKEDRPLDTKKKNPWQDLIRLMTAFLPVGLIISALTPSIVTVNPAARLSSPPRLYRRLDESAPVNIGGEYCRKRLLCEMYNDSLRLTKSRSRAKKEAIKECRSIPCEDPSRASLTELLTWILDADIWPDKGVGGDILR